MSFSEQVCMFAQHHSGIVKQVVTFFFCIISMQLHRHHAFSVLCFVFCSLCCLPLPVVFEYEFTMQKVTPLHLQHLWNTLNSVWHIVIIPSALWVAVLFDKIVNSAVLCAVFRVRLIIGETILCTISKIFWCTYSHITVIIIYWVFCFNFLVLFKPYL